MLTFTFSPRFFVPVLLGGALLAATSAVQAHGDDNLLIEMLTEELTKAPEADLFIRRGELFRHRQEWAKAHADYAAAARLEPCLASVDFFRARAFLEAGVPEEAQPFVDRYVSLVPREAEGWFLRGDILASRGRHESGAAEYAEGIRRAASPRPEHFLRRARLLAASPAADPARIVAALDEGIARLGPVISLVDHAIALDLQRRNYAGALERIAAVMERSPRREAWLVRQGDILVLWGRAAAASASYRAALAAIAELPERYRHAAPMEKLGRDASASLDRLAPN